MRMNYEGKRRRAKAAVNLSVDADVLAAAKEFGINLSEALEQRLRELIRSEAEKKWLAENRDWIEAYNRDVEENGTFGDTRRLF